MVKIREQDIDFIMRKKWTLQELFNSLDFGFTLTSGNYEYDLGGYRLVHLVYGSYELTGNVDAKGVVRFVHYKELKQIIL